MVIQSVHFTFAAADADTAEALFRELRDKSRQEEGVLTFDVGRGQEKTNIFALWEEYRDQAALEAHKATEHYKRLVIEGVRPLAKERDGAIVHPI
jgi:(4S)-4-hydroxy-5-phosphonooxypentane-2,3-dione isomerase